MSTLVNGIANRMVADVAVAQGVEAANDRTAKDQREVGPDGDGLRDEVLRDAVVEVGPDDELHYGEDMSDEIRGVAFLRGVGEAAVDCADENAQEPGEEFDYGPSGVDAIRGGAFVRGLEAPEELGCPAPAQSNQQRETNAGDEHDAPRADDVGASGSAGAARPLLQPRPPAGPAPAMGARPKRAAPAPAEVEAVAVEAETLAGAVAECLDDLAAVAETLAGAPGRALRRTRAH